MALKDDWESFAASGRVMDYLEYKGCIDRVTNLSDAVPDSDTAGNILFTLTNDRKNQEEMVKHE